MSRLPFPHTTPAWMGGVRWLVYRVGLRPRLGSIFHSPSLSFVAPLTRREKRRIAALAEEGRRLASEREDLIAQDYDPTTLLVPLHPEPLYEFGPDYDDDDEADR